MSYFRQGEISTTHKTISDLQLHYLCNVRNNKCYFELKYNIYKITCHSVTYIVRSLLLNLDIINYVTDIDLSFTNQ